LASDLSAPLTDARAIEARLALVQWLHEEPLRRERIRDALKAMPDIGRALGRLVAGRGSPRDLALLRDGLIAAAGLRAELEAEPDRPE
jgi:DNA mismatch repair protein MutS